MPSSIRLDADSTAICIRWAYRRSCLEVRQQVHQAQRVNLEVPRPGVEWLRRACLPSPQQPPQLVSCAASAIYSTLVQLDAKHDQLVSGPCQLTLVHPGCWSEVGCQAGAGELPAHAAWAGSRGAPARPAPSRAGPPLHRQGSPQPPSSLFSEPQMLSSRGHVHGHSDSGHHSPVSSSRMSTAGKRLSIAQLPWYHSHAGCTAIV